MAQQHPPRPALSEDEIKQVFAVLHLQSEEQREAMAFEAATPGRDAGRVPPVDEQARERVFLAIDVADAGEAG